MNFKNMFIFSVLLIGAVGCSHMIQSKVDVVGKQAPLFTAKAVNSDGTVFDFDLQDYLGKLIVLYFYPMDNTPGCTKQAQKFRDDIANLESKGIQVIGVSCDSIKSHKKFQGQHNLPFPLVSDSRWKRTISKLYGAAGFLYSKRKTFLIDSNGTVIKAFDKVDIHKQIDDILKAFDK